MDILITENQFKELSNILIEDKTLSPDEIYQKYYSDINRRIFDQIVEADPKTIKGVKVGRYAKLLINMFKNDNLPLEDLPKANYYLKLVYKYNRSIPNTVQTLPEIYNIIEDKIINIDLSIEDIRKYYSDIKIDTFNKIIEADPKTIKGVKIGKYAKLLLNMFRNNNLHLEDLSKVNYYLELVYKYNRSIPNTVQTLPQIFRIIEDKIINIDSSIEDILKELTEGVDYEELKGSKDWWVFIPKTEKGAAYLGVNTQWCTAWGEYSLNPDYQERKNHFKSRAETGNLYIIINKKHQSKKYQLHFEDDEFRNENDEYLSSDKKFFYNNKDLYEIFRKEMLKNITEISSYNDIINIFKKPEETIVELKLKIFEEKGFNGNLNLFTTNIQKLPEHWKIINGSIDLGECTSLTSLGNIETINEMSLYNCTSLISLGNLKKVGPWLTLENCTSLIDLGKLQRVDGILVLEGCEKIESLPENLEVGNYIKIKNSGLEKYSVEELNQMYPNLKNKWRH
jgi:hypothetical protein